MFEAKLIVDGAEFAVLRCHYHLDRDTDLSGRPSNAVRGGKITLQIESSSNTSFWDWIINHFAQKNGEIQFMKRNDQAPAKVLKFEEAYLIEYGEDFDVVGGTRDQPMTETFTLSARKIQMDPGGVFEKNWPV